MNYPPPYEPESANAPSGGSPIEIAPGVSVPQAHLRIQFARSSGPGGQNVNKLNTKAELWVGVNAIQGMTQRAKARLRDLAGPSRLTAADEIHIRAESERSQESNRWQVLEQLRQLIIQARIEPKVRRKTKPSAGAKRRRLESKRHRGEVKSLRRHRSGSDD